MGIGGYGKTRKSTNKNSNIMGTPTLKLMFDRRGRATSTKEGAIELRITYDRKQRFATTGVRVLPRQWRRGRIVNRVDAYEMQNTLDMYVVRARKILNELMERGELDMNTVVAEINGRQKARDRENVVEERELLPYFRERTIIRTYGRSEDSKERYERFLRWFEKWGVMKTFKDVTEMNILKMDEVLAKKGKKGMRPYSKWNNYHRFLNSFIIDAIDDGLMRRNPYKRIHIEKDKKSHGLEKYLTREELTRIEEIELPTEYLEHARDLFVFQTYTCLSYTDLAAFDAGKIIDVEGRKMYKGQRGKTKQGFVFLMMPKALEVLEKYEGRLPLMSNEKYNEYLKMIAVMVGVNKPVSSHWARHTGATLLLNAGVGMEVVSKILGHSSPRMTRQVYAKLLDETVMDAMERVEKSINRQK